MSVVVGTPDGPVSDMLVRSGDRVEVARTVTEADVVLFAGISGDLYEAHLNAQVMARTSFGRPLAHGALLVGHMSAAGTALIGLVRGRGDRTMPVALGYDRLRFVAPVHPGDTVTTRYEVTDVDPERRRSEARIEAINQHGVTVAAAIHHMKWLETQS